MANATEHGVRTGQGMLVAVICVVVFMGALLGLILAGGGTPERTGGGRGDAPTIETPVVPSTAPTPGQPDLSALW